MAKFYYDWSTRNKSFVRVADALDALGVKNSKFMLSLYDPDLQHVNPFDVNLSVEYQAKILFECSRNKWYFLRELAKVKDQGSEIPMDYEANIGNISLHFLRDLNINTYMELPRQCGKSISAVAEYAYFFLFGKSINMGLFNYDTKMVAENIDRIMLLLDSLPAWMHFHRMEEKVNAKDPTAAPEYKFIPKSAARKMTVENKLNKNIIVGKTPGLTEAQADTAARGGSYLHQWWDEPCNTHNFDIAADAAFPSFTTVAENAGKKGIQHSIMITSTPPDVDSREGKYLFTFVHQESTKWSLYYFDHGPTKLRSILKQNGKRDFFYITFQWYQLGKTKAWLEKQIANMTSKAIRKDIYLIWEKDIEGNPFSQQELGDLENTVLMHSYYKEIEIEENLFFKIYCNSDVRGEYNFKETMRFLYTRRILISSDVAGGEGGDRDFSTLVGIDPITSDVIFTFRSNELDPHKFAQLIIKFIKLYCSKGIICMERNSYGRAVLSELRDPVTGIPDNILYMPMSDSMVKSGVKADRGNKMAGIYTLKPLRDRLFGDILRRRVCQNKFLFRSKDLFSEVCTLQHKKGRVDHKQGSHDDLIMAYIIGCYVLYDMYSFILADYPDTGYRADLNDNAIELALMGKGLEPSMTNIYTVVATYRNTYKQLDGDNDLISMKEVSKDTMTIDKMFEIINMNPDMEIDVDFKNVTKDKLMKTVSRMNEKAKYDSAKELGLSDNEIRALKALRDSVKDSEHIEFNDDGSIVNHDEVVKKKGVNIKPQNKKKLLNIF